MMQSLRWRLGGAVAVAVGVVLLLAGFWLAGQLRAAMEQAARTRLQATAEHLSAFLPFESPEPWSQGEYAQPYSGHYWVLVAWPAGQVPAQYARSASLTDFPLLDGAVKAFEHGGQPQLWRQQGPLDQDLISVLVPLPVGPEPGRFMMLIAAPAEPLDTQTRHVIGALWRGGVIIWLLSIVTAGLAIAAAARPIHLLQRQLEDLDQARRQRLDAAVPLEFQGLVRGFNSVLDQHARTVARHRDAVARLAHELKTPLAALQQDAEAADTVPARTVLARVRRMLPPIEQEVAKARIHGPTPGLEPVLLAEQIRRAVQVCCVDHAITPADIELRVPDTLRLPIEARDLYAVVWNLIDNALRHGGLPVRVQAEAAGFEVHDAGTASQPASSSGLGLGLVETVLETYGWHYEIRSSELGGRCVRVSPRSQNAPTA